MPLKQKTIPKGIKRLNFAPKKPMAFKISENDFCYFFFKI